MKVFLSWSGERSLDATKKLSSWLQKLIQAIEPWMSPDITKGTRSHGEIAKSLEDCRVGIICLTRDNLNERWILFEAGALSKTKDALVCTFLLDVRPAEVEEPLAQFQHTIFEKEDIWKLVKTINAKVQECEKHSLPEKELEELFEVLWPDLEQALREIKDRSEEKEEPRRTDRQVLEEILVIVRDLKNRPRLTIEDILPEPAASGGDLPISSFLRERSSRPTSSGGLRSIFAGQKKDENR